LKIFKLDDGKKANNIAIRKISTSNKLETNSLTYKLILCAALENKGFDPRNKKDIRFSISTLAQLKFPILMSATTSFRVLTPLDYIEH
jgi:hypothetical protein